MSILTETPLSYSFNDREVKELHTMLEEVDRQTLVTPVSSCRTDLFLNSEGRTTGGYRYTDGALAQLCALVAPGLYQLILDLSGQWRKPGEDKRLFNIELAIETFNRAMQLRFDRKLVGLQAVRNTRNKTLDGVVGAKYRFLSNSDFVNRITQVACDGHSAKFHEACLYGRHLVVRFKDQASEKDRYVIAGDQYVPGYHFANTEIGGRSVRAAGLLVRCDTGDCILSPFAGKAGGRVVHSGRDFEKRMHGLFDSIIRSLPIKTDIEAGGRNLENKILRLGTEDHERRTRFIVQTLTRRKLNQDFARRVVSSTAAMGRDKRDSLADQLPMDQKLVLQRRTGYDLLAALIREARNLPIDQREAAEQVAHTLLTNKNWLSE